MPLHPILVNFTAALFPAAVLSDILGRISRRPSLHSAGWWMLLYAAVITPLTALAGWLWLRQMQDLDHWQMPIHQWLGIALAAVLPLLALWRWRIRRREDRPGVAYFVAGAIILGALVYQGHLGGQMTFGAESGSDVHSDGDDEHPHTPEWRPYIELKK